MTLELLAKLAEHAETRPDDPAVRLLGVGREEALSWRELHDRTAACAARLAADVKAGGVVMLCSPNAPLFSAAFLAALAAGMKLFPVSAELTAVEVAELAEHTEPQLVIGDDFAIDRLDGVVADALSFTQLRDLPEATMPTQGKASDLLLLSSGTTSRSKIVRRTGKSLDAAARTITHAVQLTADDAVLAAVPQCHSYGLEHGILAPTYVGARVTQTRGFDGRAVLHLVSDGDLTVLPGVPFMFEALAQATEEPAQLEGLRVAYSAGAPLPARVFDDLHDRLGLTVGQVYGSTEVGSVTFNAPDNGTFDAGCVGRAMNGVAIRILDPAEPKVSKPLPPGEDGHVAISSHAMLEEYIGDDAPIEQGFFLTGDPRPARRSGPAHHHRPHQADDRRGRPEGEPDRRGADARTAPVGRRVRGGGGGGERHRLAPQGIRDGRGRRIDRRRRAARVCAVAPRGLQGAARVRGDRRTAAHAVGQGRPPRPGESLADDHAARECVVGVAVRGVSAGGLRGWSRGASAAACHAVAG